MNQAEECVERIEAEMSESWLPRIYRERILKMRTRAYHFPTFAKNTRPEIHHTLLGIELKLGRHRMLCPDLATARYLAVFARAGARAVAIPYDITTLSSIAEEIESSWHHMLLLAEEMTKNRNPALRTRIRRRLIGKVNEEIAKAGPGRSIPEFKQSTRQRRSQNRER